MDTCRFGRPQNCAEIVRIFHSIEKDKKRWLASLLRPPENLLRAAVGFRGNKCDDALVPPTRYQPVECRLGLDMNRDLLRSRQLNDLGELPIGSKHKQTLQGARVRQKCFPNGVQPVQQIRRASASTGWCRLDDPR